MPTRPPVASTLKWEIIQKLGDDLSVVNVLHLEYGDPPPISVPNLTALGGTAKANWDALIVFHQTTALTVEEHIFTDLHTATGNQVTIADGTAGTDASVPVTAGAAMVVSQRTALRGRSFRGRLYLAGMGRSELAGGGTDPQHWDPAFVAGVQTSFGTLAANLLAAAHSSVPAIVSYFGPPTIKAGAIAPGNPKRNVSTARALPLLTPVTSFLVDARVGSQRRRNA